MKTQRTIFLLVILSLLVGRAVISGQGMLDDSDGVDYYAAEDAVDSLIAGNITSSISNIALTEGKPTETLLKMTLVPIHRLWARVLGVPRHSVKGLLPLGAFNTLVSIGILLVFYRLLLALGLSGLMSVVGVGMLGVTVNFNLYSRHLLPYDLGLLFNLLAVLSILKGGRPYLKRIKLAALFASMGFTTYHGYFMFVPIVCGLVVMPDGLCGKWHWKDLQTFTRWFLILPISYELLFRFGGESYLREAFIIAGTISQGSYDEGLGYAWLYASLVEGPLGMILVFLFPVAVLAALLNNRAAKTTQLLVLILFAYLSYSIAVQCFNLFVFYGRILHMYLPFFVIGTVSMADKWNRLRSVPVACSVLLLLGVQYVFNIRDMNSIAYPRRVIDDFALSDSDPYSSYYYELRVLHPHVSNPRFKKHGMRQDEFSGDTLVVVNTAFFDHYPDSFIGTYQPFRSDGGDTLFSRLHFMSYPAYTLEYCSRTGREFYLTNEIKITVIRP